MAEIEHLQGIVREDVISEALATYKAMPASVLLAQHVLLHGALDALQSLLERGCTREAAIAMQNDVLLCLGMVAGVAHTGKVKLPHIKSPLDGGKRGRPH